MHSRSALALFHLLACSILFTGNINKNTHNCYGYLNIFKTAMLVYKFLHSGNPKYFEPFLIPRHSAYNTRRSQSDGIFLEVPHFASVFKSRKHFGLSFAYDAPMIWNDLPDEVYSANSLASFRSKLKSYLFGKAYPP